MHERIQNLFGAAQALLGILGGDAGLEFKDPLDIKFTAKEVTKAIAELREYAEFEGCTDDDVPAIIALALQIAGDRRDVIWLTHRREHFRAEQSYKALGKYYAGLLRKAGKKERAAAMMAELDRITGEFGKRGA